VSKAHLDLVFLKAGKAQHHKVTNDKAGHKKILSLIPNSSCVVMESSGPYFLSLAAFLKAHEVSVSVVNPLSVKRFIQMKGERNKSDKKDAYWIMSYGQEQPLKEWELPNELQLKCARLYSLRALYVKQLTMLTNHSQSVTITGMVDKDVKQSIAPMIKHFKLACEKLDAKLDKLLKEWQPEQYRNLQTIPGVGKQVAMVLIIKTNGFSNLENYRQLISMAGLTPREYSSGSSVRAKVRICKNGGSEIRRIVYLSSMTAIRYNRQCKTLFDRLKCRGKNGKVALIAVCNKILKQAFAIAKSGVPYHADYTSKLVVN